MSCGFERHASRKFVAAAFSAGQCLRPAGASGGSARLELDAFAGGGMVEREPARMQEHALEAQPGTASPRASGVEREVAVLVVADDRVAGCARWTRIWCVRPVLIVTSSSVVPAEALHDAHQRDRALAIRVVGATARTRRSPAASLVTCAAPRRSPSVRRPAADDERGVGLAGLAARGTGPGARSARCASWPAAACPRSRGRAGARARGSAPRAAPAQLLDDAEADARAAMDRHAGRLVDREQVLVLEQDREFARRRGLGGVVDRRPRARAAGAPGRPRRGACRPRRGPCSPAPRRERMMR